MDTVITQPITYPIYSLSWCNRPDKRFLLAVSSLMEDHPVNKIQLLKLSLGENPGEIVQFKPLTDFDHLYPPSKIMWSPPTIATTLHGGADLMATSGDALRLWDLSNPHRAIVKSHLSLSKLSDFSAPLTSFDWCQADPTMIGTSSIDTTCTMWDIVTSQPKLQLITNESEVCDISFPVSDPHLFATAGGEGTLSMFDLRTPRVATILYKDPERRPLVRVEWNKMDPGIVATFALHSSRLSIFNMAMPSKPIMELVGYHTDHLNSFAWAPHSAGHLCTVGQDKQIAVWDLSSGQRVIDSPCRVCKTNQHQQNANQVVWPTSRWRGGKGEDGMANLITVGLERQVMMLMI